MSRCTWSSSPPNSRSSAPKFTQTDPMISWHLRSMAPESAPRLYLVVKTRWTCRLYTTLRPLRTSGSGVHRGDMDQYDTLAHMKSVVQVRLIPNAAQKVALE